MAPTPKIKRTCGSCSLCCKVMGVPEVKQRHAWCPHCSPGCGCIIYESRPERCRQFNCLWLVNPQIKDHWFPAKSRIVIDTSTPATVVFVVDPDYPLRWREQPWLADIKAIARAGFTSKPGWTTVIMIKDQTIPITP